MNHLKTLIYPITAILMLTYTPILSVAQTATQTQTQTQTQTSEPESNSKIELGARFMPTFSSFEMKTSAGGVVEGKFTFGYGGGVFVGYNFSNHIGLQAEVMYFSLSQKYKEVDVERNINLRYLNIPLLFSLNTGKSKRINGNLSIGPQIGISVGSTLNVTGEGPNPTANAVLVVKKGDIGFAYGAGIDIGLNRSKSFRLGVGFRGVYGLLDISDNSKTTATDQYYILDRTHIQTYSAYIGLSFLL